MLITIVNQYYPPDLAPTAHLAASLAKHRAAVGDDVTVITSSATYASGELLPDPAADERENFRILRVSAPKHKADSIAARARQYLRFYMGAAWRLARLPRQDVIVSLTTPPYIGYFCAWRKWLKGDGRLILWNMDCYPDILEATRLIKPCGAVAKCLGFATRRLLHGVDHVVCLDEAMRDLLRHRYAPPNLSMTIIPNWEPLALFPGDRHVAPWSGVGELSLEDRLIVLYLGNAGYGHEFGAVLDAAEALRHEPVTFLFVGGGSKHPEVETQARQRGLNNVVLHTYVRKEQTPEVLAAADLSLITLSDEALGMMCPSKLHACLAMGVPVVYVGPPGSNVHHAIEQFRCGVSIRNGDAASLVAFLHNALHDRAILITLRQQARAAFDAAYCDAATLPQFDALLEGDSAIGNRLAVREFRGCESA